MGAIVQRPRKVRGVGQIHLANDVFVGSNAWIEAISHYGSQKFEPQIIIGERSSIGRYACITATNLISIGKDCLISEHFYASDHFHGTDPRKGAPIEQDLHSRGPVKIGDSCFIGYRATILPGVTLGKNCVVGAHSVVTKSFPDYSMIAGAPAKLIKFFDPAVGDWVSPPNDES